MNSNQVSEMVTAQVIKGLKEGNIAWHKSWISNASGYQNFHSGHQYSGVNTLLLNLACIRNKWEYPLFASFKQINNFGGKVNKNEYGTTIVFAKRIEVQDKNNPDQKRQISLLKNWTVFNLNQTSLDPKDRRIAKLIKTETLKPFDIIANAEAVIENSQASIKFGGDVASYSQKSDIINLPDRNSFDSERDYYNTAFHELVHWTGHASRLDRLTPTSFGSDEYSQEELVAEIGSNMVAFTIGMTEEITRNSQAYVNHWLSVLQTNNPNFIIQASSKAEKASILLTQ